MKQGSLCILLLLALLNTAESQQKRYPVLWRAFISIGYADATSGIVREYDDLIVNSYRSDGIPIPTQIPFGRTALINAGILFTQLKDIWFGFCVGYSYSPSYSNYKDYAGTLKINGSINSYELSLRIKASLDQIGDFPITVSVQPGIAHVASSITQELRISDLSVQHYDWNWSASTWGPFFQSTLGISIPVRNFIISLEGGYKFS